MALLQPGLPWLRRLKDLVVGAADPADDTAPNWWARIRKAIMSAAMGAVAVPAAWVAARTGVEIPVEWYEPLVAGVVGGLLNWAATYFPRNKAPAP